MTTILLIANIALFVSVLGFAFLTSRTKANRELPAVDFTERNRFVNAQYASSAGEVESASGLTHD